MVSMKRFALLEFHIDWRWDFVRQKHCRLRRVQGRPGFIVGISRYRRVFLIAESRMNFMFYRPRSVLRNRIRKPKLEPTTGYINGSARHRSVCTVSVDRHETIAASSFDHKDDRGG